MGKTISFMDHKAHAGQSRKLFSIKNEPFNNFLKTQD